MSDETLATLVPATLLASAGNLSGRAWALRAVSDWFRATGAGGERLFLLTGEPGVGKSVLSAWFAGAGPPPADPADDARLSELREAWSARCFCVAAARGGRSDTAWFIGTLVRQLSARFDDYATAVIEAVQQIVPGTTIDISVRENRGQVIGARVDFLSVSVPNASDRFAYAVLDPLDRIARVHPELDVRILIDGLDEAIVGEAPTIVDLVVKCASLPANVRFFVTTRGDPKVTGPLRRAFGTAAELDLSAPEVAAQNEADIAAHVARRLAEPAVAARITVSGTTADHVLPTIVTQAAGNFQYVDFLLDQWAGGEGPLGALAELPTKLFDLYARYLDAIVPNMHAAGVNQDWLDRYQPLLGSISVAAPAAPKTTLWRWLRWKKDALNVFITAVLQVTEYVQEGGGGWRLFHRSMADFLGSAENPAQPGELNVFYVAPAEQHERIAAFYLDALAAEWAGSWQNCDDVYCLRNLAHHIRESLAAAASSADRAQRADALYRLVADPAFRERQNALLGGWQFTLEALADALDTAAAANDGARAIDLLESMGSSPDVELRGRVREALVKVHGGDPDTAVSAMKQLLSSDSSGAWSVALHAALAVV